MLLNISSNEDNKDLVKNLTEDEKWEIVMDNLGKDGIMLYRIPITINVTSDDNWVDIKNQIIKAIDNKNIYNYIKEKIMERNITTNERIRLLHELEDIKYNYKSMIDKSDELIGEKLTFYLQSQDISVIVK